MAKNQMIILDTNQPLTEADFLQSGQDLIVSLSDGSVITVENYFMMEPQPSLNSGGGDHLSPRLVQAFLTTPGAPQYAQNGLIDNGATPVGEIAEMDGDVYIIRNDGSRVEAVSGSPVYEGDIVETEGTGAANIIFVDETSFAISEDARFAIEGYSFDAASESGSSDFSVLKGVFVFTSGLIGRDNPDDVEIETPVGTIGIRGTIIAGKIAGNGEDTQITVVEGAIVVRNGFGEQTLSSQFETVTLNSFDGAIRNVGTIDAGQMAQDFGSVQNVAPTLFSTFGTSQNEPDQPQDDDGAGEAVSETQGEEAQADEPQAEASSAESVADASAEVAPEPQTQQQPQETVNQTETRVSQSGPREPGRTNANDRADARADGESNEPGQEGDATISQAPANAPPPPPPVQPLQVQITEISQTLNEDSQANIFVARVETNVNFDNAQMTLLDTKGGRFTLRDSNETGRTINGDRASIIYTGEDSLDAGNVNLAVRVTLPDGRSVTKQLTVQVADVAENFYDLQADGTESDLGFRLSDDNGESAGGDVAALGDINNDGFDDFILTRTGDDTSFITILGDDTLLSGTTLLDDLTATQKKVDSFSNIGGVTNSVGASVAGVGDFDNDGTNDFVIGAPNFNQTAYIINGALDPDSASANAQIRVEGGTDSGFGFASSGIGDINGDGFDDMIISAPNSDGNDGGAFVLFGNDGGFGSAATPSTISTASLSSGDGKEALFTNSSPDGLFIDHFGESVAGLGDINGDGLADFAVGARGFEGDGAVFMYSGQTNTTTLTATRIDGGSDAADTNGFGSRIEALGDVDADGINDFMIFNPEGNDGNGTAHVVYGSTSLTETDINIDSLVSGGDAIAIHDEKIFTISGAGDFNGDGHDDFAFATDQGTFARIYVAYGSDSRASITDFTTLESISNGYVIDYNYDDLLAAGERTFNLESVGDVNGDGLDDLAIGVPQEGNTSSDNGAVYIALGQDVDNRTTTGTSADNTFVVTDDSIISAGAGDDIIRIDGGDDHFLRGGNGDDTFEITENALEIDRLEGGAGEDTLKLLSDSDSLDLTTANINGIETILLDGDNQSVTLDRNSILALFAEAETSGAGRELIFDQSETVATNGSVSDLSSNSLTSIGFNRTGTAQDSFGNGDLFFEYTKGDQTLYVDSDITNADNL